MSQFNSNNSRSHYIQYRIQNTEYYTIYNMQQKPTAIHQQITYTFQFAHYTQQIMVFDKMRDGDDS